MEPERPPVGPTMPAPPPGRLGAVQIGGRWLLVVVVAALGLRVADALPRVALNVPRGVVRTADVAALERASGRRMPVPAYFPDTIAWPPAEARLHSSGSAAIWCRLRAGGDTALIVATAPPGAAGISDAVLPASVDLQREPAALGDRMLLVSRVRHADGAVWQQVRWQAPAQIILIRYRGTLDELLKMARSVND